MLKKVTRESHAFVINFFSKFLRNSFQDLTSQRMPKKIRFSHFDVFFVSSVFFFRSSSHLFLFRFSINIGTFVLVI